jgi:hypothetical protein
MIPNIGSVESHGEFLFFSFFLSFCGTGLWTQGLHLEPLHKPFFVIFFWDRVCWTICPGWLRTMILLISASWEARIIGVSHRHPENFRFLFVSCSSNIFILWASYTKCNLLTLGWRNATVSSLTRDYLRCGDILALFLSASHQSIHLFWMFYQS